MTTRPCALVVFGIDTPSPTIIVVEEATLAAIPGHGWLVLARESDVFSSAFRRGPSGPGARHGGVPLDVRGEAP